MKARKPLIIGLGEILWDMLPGGKMLGGAPANFAYHCSQLGAESYVISAIGKDDLGCEILENVEQLNLPSEYLVIEERYPTGTVTVSLDAQGNPKYIIHKNVAWDYIPVEETALNVISIADALCFGSLAQRSPISRRSVVSYLEGTHEDCLKVFDINLRQQYYTKDVLESSLELADILKLNDEELVILEQLFALKGNEEQQINSLLRTFDLKLIALTKGGDGSSLFTASERSDYQSEAVEAVDTVGAGDSFTAAMVMGLLQGIKLEDLHKMASELAAYVCTRKGATPEIPENLRFE